MILKDEKKKINSYSDVNWKGNGGETLTLQVKFQNRRNNATG